MQFQKTDKRTISEARLNDVVYMLLKGVFFGGMNMNPRECDIRVCMQMAVPELRTGVQDAILLPNERSGRSHTRMLDVCFGTVFDECLTYLEDHWMKQSFENASGDPDVRQKMWDWFAVDAGEGTSVLEVLLELPEEECARDGG